MRNLVWLMGDGYGRYVHTAQARATRIANSVPIVTRRLHFTQIERRVALERDMISACAMRVDTK